MHSLIFTIRYCYYPPQYYLTVLAIVTLKMSLGLEEYSGKIITCQLGRFSHNLTEPSTHRLKDTPQVFRMLSLQFAPNHLKNWRVRCSKNARPGCEAGSKRQPRFGTVISSTHLYTAVANKQVEVDFLLQSPYLDKQPVDESSASAHEQTTHGVLVIILPILRVI